MGAIGAAASGAADWRHLDRSTQRVGLVHGAANTAALGAYVTSLILRRKRRRGKARIAAAIGFGLATASAYLGGSMVYRDRAGVDHAEDRSRPKAFVPVLADDELKEGEVRRVDAGGVRAVLIRQNGHIRALGEVCPHLGGPLADGTLEGDGLRCPWHGSRFSLDDGRVLDGPAPAPAPCFENPDLGRPDRDSPRRSAPSRRR